jgi:hypothetical protein
MNDYWNDPPDYPEPPECCGDCMDVKQDGACVCPNCGKRIEFTPDIDPPDVPEEDFGNIQDVPYICPHGNADECDACDHASDIAFDAGRERRVFKR